MHLTKCIIWGADLPGEISFDISDSGKITIIRGENGSGKTLLAKGIIYSIFKKNKNSSLLSEKKLDTFNSDITFSISGEKFKIINNSKNRFSLSSISDNNEENIIFQGDKDILSSSIPEKFIHLKKIFSEIDSSIFYNTSFIPGAADITREGNIDYEVIKKIIINDTSKFNKLHEDLENSFINNKINNYSISRSEKEKEYNELSKKIVIAEMNLSRIKKINIEKINLDKEIYQLKNSIDKLSSNLKILKTISSNLDIQKRFHEDYNKIKTKLQDEEKRIDTILINKKQIKSDYPQFQDITKISYKELDLIQKIFNKIKNINQKIDSKKTYRNLIKDRISKISFYINISALSIIASFIFKKEFIFHKTILIPASILGFSIIFYLFFLMYIHLREKFEKPNPLYKTKEISEKELKDIINKHNISIDSFEQDDLFEFLIKYFEDYIDFSERTMELVELKRESIEGKELNIIKEKIDKLNIEKSELDNKIIDKFKELDQLIPSNSDKLQVEEEIRKNEFEMSNLKKQIKDKESIIQQIEKDRNFNNEDERDIKNLKDEKDNISKKLEQVDSNINLINFIYSNLTEAIKIYEEKQLEKLLSLTYKNFNILTGNHYLNEIVVSDIKELLVNNSVSEKFTATLLHLIIISIKISLTDFLNNFPVSIPLIIDDPFNFMDEKRIERFKNIILELSEKRQIIIFTNRNNLTDWGNLIQL